MNRSFFASALLALFVLGSAAMTASARPAKRACCKPLAQCCAGIKHCCVAP